MKVIYSLAALALFVSFNVHAIPPPPSLPKAIGVFNAKLRVHVSMSKVCNDMICTGDVAVCEFDVKIPVVPGSLHDEAYNSSALLDAATGKPVTCGKVFEGINHYMRISAYATLNNQGLVKVISRTSSGKQVEPTTGRELSLFGGNTNITWLSQQSPVLMVKNFTNESLQQHTLAGVRPLIANTQSSVTTTLEFASLQPDPAP